MTDDSIMPFGKYEGKKLGDVPDDYLLWLYGELDEAKYPELIQYLDDNIDAIRANLKT